MTLQMSHYGLNIGMNEQLGDGPHGQSPREDVEVRTWGSRLSQEGRICHHLPLGWLFSLSIHGYVDSWMSSFRKLFGSRCGQNDNRCQADASLSCRLCLVLDVHVAIRSYHDRSRLSMHGNFQTSKRKFATLKESRSTPAQSGGENHPHCDKAASESRVR